MISKLISNIEQNKNKDISIDPIRIKLISDTNDFEELPPVGPGNVGVVPLDPPGPVSLYLWHTNCEYRAGSFLTRKVILRETIIKLHERFESELKGRQWNRKKASELLEEQDSSAVSPNQHTPELNKAICYVFGFQYAELDEIHKKISWYPSDIRTWTKEHPIYLVSLGCRSIYINYNCEWPYADGTVKELKEQLNDFNLSIPSKAKKEEYQQVIGKAQALKHINNEFFN